MMLSQNRRVKSYLESHGSINPITALNELGIMRLASRIADLRRQGVPIKKTMVKDKNRWGEDIMYAEYSLMEVKDA